LLPFATAMQRSVCACVVQLVSQDHCSMYLGAASLSNHFLLSETGQGPCGSSTLVH